MGRRFVIEIRDYDSGLANDALTTDRIESAIVTMLDNDGSDGIVIVTEEEE